MPFWRGDIGCGEVAGFGSAESNGVGCQTAGAICEERFHSRMVPLNAYNTRVPAATLEILAFGGYRIDPIDTDVTHYAAVPVDWNFAAP